MTSIIYHLVLADYWETQPTDRPYVPADYDHEGFVHCTRGDDQLTIVANRYYRDDWRKLLVLVLNEDVLTSEVRDESAPDGVRYPHVYGPLNRDAIIEVLQMPRSLEGEYQRLRRS